MPVDTNSKISATAGIPLTDPSLYRSLVGALEYLIFTHPDIPYVFQQVCLFMYAPLEPHFNFLKRILRYLKRCPDFRHSTSDYCVYLSENLFSWSSKRQPTISGSSVEAEYKGVANAMAETTWLGNLLLELHLPLHRATIIYCDNISAVYLAKNPVQQQCTKHVKIDIHFVREKVCLGSLHVLHVPADYQYTNIFTKRLPSQLFIRFSSSLTIRPATASTAEEY